MWSPLPIRSKTQPFASISLIISRYFKGSSILNQAEWRLNAFGAETGDNSGHDVADHFLETTKMVGLGSGAQREVADFMLTRYACYLVAQNGDPSKDQIAFAQTYFAVQTRKQEIIEKRLGEVERLNARRS